MPSFIRIERGSDGTHDFKLNKVPFSALKLVNINVSLSAAQILALMPANRYNCNEKGSNLNKLNKVPFSALKSVNITVSRSAAPKLALVTASRYFCEVK